VTCLEVETLMVQAAQGELPPSEQARLHRHLSRCPDCQKTFGELQGVWEMLDAWKVPEPPPGLAKFFSTRLAETAAQTRRPSTLLQKLERPHVQWTRLRLGWNLAGLAMAAGLAFGVFYVFNLHPNGPGNGTSGTHLTEQRTPAPADAHPLLAVETPRARTSIAAVAALNRVAPDGVYVDRYMEPRPRSAQVHFAVDNFSTNVPEISTKHYNTVATLYEDPF